MTISERIFEKIESLGMTQSEFAARTGIKPSTISEWKKNKTNPSSEKIMPICEALDVTPDWLLSGIDGAAGRETCMEYYTVKKDTEMGRLIAYYNLLQPAFRERVMGYVEAFSALDEKGQKKTE